MTYYFATKADLVLAATLPVMNKAVGDLFSVIDLPESFDLRFRKIIMQFISFAHENASLLDLFVEASMESGNKEAHNLINSCLHKLSIFLALAVEAGVIAQNTNPSFVLLALWGTCRSIGERVRFPIQVFDVDMPIEDVRTAQANLILNLFLRGTGDQSPAESQSSAASRGPDAGAAHRLNNAGSITR